MLKKFAVLITIFAIAGCSEPKPVEIDIDIDKAAAKAGLAPEEYEVDEHGNIKVYSKVDTAITSDDVIAAPKKQAFCLSVRVMNSGMQIQILIIS